MASVPSDRITFPEHYASFPEHYANIGWHRGWKALTISLPHPRPQGLREWAIVIWGADIWVGKRFPLVKATLSANVLAWVGIAVTT